MALVFALLVGATNGRAATSGVESPRTVVPARFGVPKTVEEYKVATLVGIRDSKLNHHYLHTAAAEFNKARGLKVPTAAYPSYFATLASAARYPTEAQRAVVRAASDSSARHQDVRAVIAWLPSVGGEQWFRNYVRQFGRPETSCVFEFHGGDLFARSLKHYYLGHPVRGGKPLVDPDCFVSLGNQYGIADRFTTSMVAHMALSNWDAFLLTGNEDFRERFLEHAQLMRSRQSEGRWEWQIEIPPRGLKAPWISGMTQSLGVSVFLRAYQLTGDQDYLTRATAAFKWLREPVSRGGVAIKTEEGTWYEEYPNAEVPSHVLNGHVWALFGIWDYFRATRDPYAARMFREGIDILKSQIHRYDVGHWVVYDQLNQVDVVNGFYVGFIVEQLEALHALTGDADFQRFAIKWANYQLRHSLFGHMAFEEYAKATKGSTK